MTERQRVIAYIDGFNLYFGLRESGLRRCYWLNLRALTESLLHPGQVLVATKYFTARIAGGRRGDTPHRRRIADQKRKRQSDYLEALDTLGGFQRCEGRYGRAGAGQTGQNRPQWLGLIGGCCNSVDRAAVWCLQERSETRLKPRF